MSRKTLLFLLILIISGSRLCAQQVKTTPAITAHDIMERESILASDSLEGRRTGAPGAEKAANYIATEFKRIGLTAYNPVNPEAPYHPNYFQPFDFSEHALDTTKHGKTQGMNVLGFLQGSDPALSSQFVIIGAHYDHLGYGGAFALDTVHAIHYGADDNASGVTGLLEIAENMAKMPRPKRSILFISFSGEEEGLFGSDYFVNNPLMPLTNVQAMVNMDMIGRMKDSTLIIEGIGTSPVFRSLVDSLNTPTEFHLKYFQSGTGPSDHAKFYSKNLPVLFLFTGIHEDYHKATDTKEKINAEGEVKVTKYVENILLDLANRQDKIPFTRVANDTEQKAASFGVYVGGVPDYGYDGDGLRISEIRDHSPAQVCGLFAGDVITQFDELMIHNIYDYTNALAKRLPGDIVQMKVQRDGKLVIVPVVLGRRATMHQ
jgi:Peptidase family M28/PDZ domain